MARTKVVLGAAVAVGVGLDDFPDDPMAAAEMRPRRRKERVELEALLVERPGLGHVLVAAGEVVGSEIELVGARIVRNVGRR